MFYSHTFLARKGPLGTVWCAAHLQHKLSKSHYISTNIPASIKRILSPEIPIALRMSGHLLLGVVRIYSKKVDYFQQDCKGLLKLINAFSTVNLDLDEDATHAAVRSINLPETFELDTLPLEDDSLERSKDNHLKRPEEIMLEDQIPTGKDPRIIITHDEDIRKTSLVLENASGSGPMPMEENSHHSIPEEYTVPLEDPSFSNHAGFNKDIAVWHSSPIDLPEIEIMRDAGGDFHMETASIWPDQHNDFIEPDRVLEEQIMKDKEASDKIVEEMLASGGPSLPSLQPQEPTSVASEQAHENLDLNFSPRHGSPELEIRPTPSVVQPRARQRKRSRRQFYDESTVLTNKYMKKTLQDPSSLCREKRNCPSSNLDAWRLCYRLKKDAVFLEPLITGLSTDLRSIYNSQFISSKPLPASTEEDHKEVVAQSPASRDNIEMETEQLRNYEVPAGANDMSVILPSPHEYVPSRSMTMASPSRRDQFTPSTVNFESQSEQLRTNIGPEVRPTPDFSASTGLRGSDMETTATLLNEGLGFENGTLPDIPELVNSADLYFLEQDDNTPAGSQRTLESGYSTRKQGGSLEFDSLSARTRAVAQIFLRRQSSVTPNSAHLTGNLSFLSILEGKNRKICARMFYETLVLKNCGLIDVHQEEPYGDINLKVTPKLSKEQ